MFITDLCNLPYLIDFLSFYLNRMNFRISHWSGQRHLVTRTKQGKPSWHTSYPEKQRGKTTFLMKNYHLVKDNESNQSMHVKALLDSSALSLWICFETNVLLVLNLEVWFFFVRKMATLIFKNVKRRSPLSLKTFYTSIGICYLPIALPLKKDSVLK